MTIDFNLIVVFQFFVIVQGLTTAVLLLSSTRRKKQNMWMGLLVAGMTLQVIDAFFSVSGIYRDNNWLYFSPFFYTWGYGALLFFHIRSATDPSFSFNRRHWRHFAPVAFQFLFFSVIALQSLGFKTWFWLNVHKPYTRYVDYYIGVALTIGYLRYGLIWLPKADLQLRWLRVFIRELIVFYIVAAIDPLVNHWYPPGQKPRFYLTQLVLPVFVYWLGITAYVKERFRQNVIAKPKADKVFDDAPQLRKVSEWMRADKPFLNPDLTLTDLANQTGMTPNALSLCLNAGFGKSFNDFVNGYRIEEVKRRLQAGDTQRLTLLGIAYESGFNSKTTFNRVFKETTGMSPKAYKNMFQNVSWND